MKLTIELIPKTSFFNNLRSHLSKSDWNRLRRETYKKANYKCEICNGTGDKWPIECHEIWSFDEEKRIQKLEGLIGLCPMCHQVKHIGLTKIKGNEKEAIKHLMFVNAMNEKETYDYVSEAFNVWRERGKHTWKLDLSWLDKKVEENGEG